MKRLDMLLKLCLIMLPLYSKALPNGSLSTKNTRYATVRVTFIHKPIFDSLFTVYFNDNLYDGYWDSEKPKAIPVLKNGVYYFKIPVVDSFVYFKLFAKKPVDYFQNHNNSYYPITNYNYLQNGDLIDLIVDYQEDQSKPKPLIGRLMIRDFKVRFEGRGAFKCRLNYTIDSMLTLPPNPITTNIVSDLFTDQEVAVTRLIDSVFKGNQLSSQLIYRVIKANIMLACKKKSVGNRSYFLVERWRNKDSMVDKLIESYRSLLMTSLKSIAKEDDRKYLLKSPEYLPYKYEVLTSLNSLADLKNGLLPNPHMWNTVEFLNILLNNTTAETRDRLIVYHFKTTSFIYDREKSINACLAVSASGKCKTFLRSLFVNLGKEPAHNFSLTDTSGNIVKLSDYAGKVVFIDFWFTGCANCTVYYHGVLKEVEARLRNDTNVVFVSISTDVNKQKWIASIFSDKYTSGHAINLYTGGNGINDLVIKKFNINGFPTQMLIDKNGYIREYKSLVLYDKDKLIDRIKSLL